MTENPDSDHDSTQPNSGHDNGKSSHLRWVFTGGGIAVIGLLLASIWWPNLTERTKFFTANLLNLVIALAVIAQALIYRRQRDIMRGQWRVMEGQGKAMQGQLEAMREQYAAEKDFMKLQIHNLSDQSDVMEASYELSKQSIRQNEQTVKAMRGQLAAMERQEQAMREQAKLMDRSLVIGTRAYVCLSDLNVDFTDTKQLSIKFENIGKVPAEKLNVKILITVSFPDPQWVVPDQVRGFSSYEVKRNYGINALYPGTFKAEIRIWLEQYLTEQEITLLAQGIGFFGIGADLYYGDGFEESQRSAFCFMYRDGGWTMHPVWPDKAEQTDSKNEGTQAKPN